MDVHEKLEKTGTRATVSFFKEYYMHEFPQLSKEFKDDSIEYIIYNNVNIFTKEQVMNFDGCNQCGTCCRELHCEYHDNETNLCTRHDNQLMDLCRTYPWGGDEYGIYPVLLNCKYTTRLFKNFFDKYFQKAVEMQGGKTCIK